MNNALDLEAMNSWVRACAAKDSEGIYRAIQIDTDGKVILSEADVEKIASRVVELLRR